MRYPALWKVAAQGTIPSLEHARVPFKHDFRTVVDVGASKGQFASFAAHRWPRARLICFEPLDDAAESLESLLEGQVEVRRVALAADPGESKIHISASSDSSSLLPMGERQISEFPGTAAVGTRRVVVSTLDREFPEDLWRPCLLKVDVQGLEVEVLKGGGRVLRQVDEALIECSYVELYEGQALAVDVIAQMEAGGFQLVGRSEPLCSPDGEELQADLLFRRL